MREIIALVNKSSYKSGIAKTAIKTFEKLVQLKIPGSEFVTEDGIAGVQTKMKAFWAKNKKDFTTE